MTLRVRRAGGVVELSLPPVVTRAKALAFLEEKEHWIRGQLAQSVQAAPIEEGAFLPYLGERRRLVIDPRLRHSVLEAAVLRLPGPEVMLQRQAATFLKERAHETVPPRIAYYAARVGRQATKLTLRDTRSRWGSCGSKGQIMINWRLMMAPFEVLDYVIAHEVAHLAHLDHSPAFWGCVARLYPRYEAQKRWLSAHGAALQAVVF